MKYKTWLIGRSWLTCLGWLVAASGTAEELQLTLPPVVYAVPNLESAIYFDNIVLTQSPGAYRFDVTCDLGTQEATRWTVTPRADSRGDHPVTVRVQDVDGKVLGAEKAILRVAARESAKDEEVRLLIVGDSLTHASVYPNELYRLLSQPGNPKVTLLGTHQPSGAAEGVTHEGYGGWTWQRFVSQYEPNPDGTYRKRSSPFVYLGENEKPLLDVSRYFQEECGGEPPDIVTFLLGINDCFSADPDDSDAIDARIDTVFQHADLLLTAFSLAAPEAKLAVCLTPPPNSRQEAFEANYQDRYTRWGWKRIQHRLVQRQLEHYGNREAEHIFVVPTELNLDPVGGYPVNNGVHPNESGYRQLAANIYAWLKSEAFPQGELSEGGLDG
ncbi:MAG: SGNH/GDSL hydrolase family protein [Planctomycetaceae bacterium]|nr:SGNH/GDSL hydrolase family protein [Planctomycetales bacterium]MCB9874790.1 SGNH/GDSL hydrolase family protein [Planctomycetaceae bacterium]MCB9939010.1 SGNH/GDSL hydrolase family protein [Planctomycetaceae bacterium]